MSLFWRVTITLILGMRIHINVSCHGALGVNEVVLTEVTVTKDIPKRYSWKLSMTNDIPKAWHHIHTYKMAKI